MIYGTRHELLEILLEDIPPQSILLGWTLVVCVPAATIAQLVVSPLAGAIAFSVAFGPAALVYLAGRYADGVGWYLRSREEILDLLLRLEEATVLIDGALQFVFRSIGETGRLPNDDDQGQLERLQRGVGNLNDVRGALGDMRRDRNVAKFLLEVAAGGVHSMKRFALVFNATQRVGALASEAAALIKTAATDPGRGSGGEGTPARPPHACPSVATVGASIKYATAPTTAARAQLLARESASAREAVQQLVAQERSEIEQSRHYL